MQDLMFKAAVFMAGTAFLMTLWSIFNDWRNRK